MRLAVTQAVKRCPLDLRPLLGIPPGQNPKALALFGSALVKLERLGLVREPLSAEVLDRLLALRSPGFPHFCWGYDFAWQNRSFLLPRFAPNVICSTFAGHALLDAFETQPDSRLLHAAEGVGKFILTSLNRTVDGDSFGFSYTPYDHGVVHNANLLGAAFLARLGRVTGDSAMLDGVLPAARFSVKCQSADGSWPYSGAAYQQWVDSFHTGYNLLALQRIQSICPTDWIQSSIDAGYAFYRRTFFGRGGVVRYYSHRTYPIDIHGVAHAIVTLTAFRTTDPSALTLAHEIRDWADREMLSPAGCYYFQRHRFWTNRAPHMRWGQAWMLLALTTLAEAAFSESMSPSPKVIVDIDGSAENRP